MVSVRGGVDPLNPPGQGPGELAGGLAGGGGALRVDEVDDRLGLGQVQLAVEEGPLGELPPAGPAGPRRHTGPPGPGRGPWGSRGTGARRSPLRCSCGGGAADEGQAGVDGAAVPVQDGAVEAAGPGPGPGAPSPGAEGLAGGPDGPGAGGGESPTPQDPGGVEMAAMSWDMGGTSSPKGKSLANPPANFPLTGIFDDQNGGTGLCTACGKVCGQCVKPLNSFPSTGKGGALRSKFSCKKRQNGLGQNAQRKNQPVKMTKV